MDPRLSDSETALQGRARTASATIKEAAASIDRDGVGSRASIAGLGDAGILGACLPEAHGGAGGGRVEYALICEELGAASASVAAATVGHLVAAFLIEAVGGEQEKQELLPELASGAKVATLVLDGGGSLLEAPTVAVLATGAEEISLSGVARAVAGAAHADVFVVPARADAEGEDVRAFVVERGAEGLEIGDERGKLGLNGSGLAIVTLEGVSAAMLLSGGDVAGALAEAADNARIGLAAACAGIGRAALEASSAHVMASEDGIDRAQSVQWMLADMATETEAGRLLTWYAASRQDACELREAAAMARLIAADAAVGAGRRAVEIFGAAGNDEATGVERLYRDAKAMEVHHGAMESQRREVARQLLPDLFDGPDNG